MSQSKKELETTKKSRFSLKPAERNAIAAMIQASNQEMAILFSLIAVERLAYPVTQHTQFQLSEDYSQMTISEADEGPEQANNTPKVEAA